MTFVIKDLKPISIAEGEGFHQNVSALSDLN